MNGSWQGLTEDFPCAFFWQERSKKKLDGFVVPFKWKIQNIAAYETVARGRAGEELVSRLTNLLEMKSDQTTTNEFVCITFFKWMQLFTCNMTWNKYYGLKQKFLHFSNFYKFTNYYSSESVVTVNITPCYNLLSTKSKSHFLALLTMKIKPSGLSEVERPSSEAQDIYPVHHFNPSNQVSNKVLLAGFKINLVKQFI